MKKNLVVLRCGNSSLHHGWVHSETQNWDLVLCTYQEISDDRFPKFYAPGQKWAGLLKYFTETSEWKNYDYIWLPDDDIETDGSTINKMFDQCGKYSPDLAAPALSKTSFHSHFITMVNESFVWRRTSFVEIMVPCISSIFIERVIKSFSLSKSGTGFGLDFLWPALLQYKNIMIFDNVAMRHTRPIGGFRSDELGYAATNDMYFITRSLGVPQAYKTFEGCTIDGRIISANNPQFFALYTKGYEYISNNDEKFLKFIDELQLFDGKIPSLDHIYSTIDFFDRRRVKAIQSVALKKPCLVSSVSKYSRSQDPAIEAEGGNDGLINGHCRFHTDFETDPWWQVDLQTVYAIRSIEVYNRLDVKNRCVKLIVLISNDKIIWKLAAAKLDDRLFGGADGFPYSFEFVEPISAQFVRIQLVGEGYLHLDQIEIFGEILNADSTIIGILENA